jgi:hypothetical protein
MEKVGSVLSARSLINEDIEPDNPSPKNRIVFVFVFWLVLLASIGLRIYKADHAGIGYDESVNYKMFGRDIHTALNSYPLPNNHVLNSIFIYYAHKYFGSYEHFIRIPSLTAGIIFSLALAYIVWKTIQSNAMRIAVLAMVSFVPHVVAFSIMSRGYAFGLAGIFVQIAFVLWLLEHKIKFRYWPVPVLVISLMNFLAFGAMLSSFILLGAFNLTFAVLYSPKVFRNAPNRLSPMLLNLISIPIASFIPIFFLYRGLYRQILECMETMEFNKAWSGWPDFVTFLRLLLIKWAFGPNDNLGWIIFYVIIGLVVVSLAFHIYKFCIAVRAGTGQRYLQGSDSRTFIFVVTGLAILFMFVYSVIGRKDLGFARNQVFLIPLVLISGCIILDGFGCGLAKNTLGRIVRTVIILAVIAPIVYRPPSPYRFGGMTISGPILRKLKAIDPDKTWYIAFSKRMKLYGEAVRYYEKFNYKFYTVHRGRYDVMIYYKDERPIKAVCLEWDYFSPSKCAVVVNCQLPTDRVILEVRLLRD